MSRIQEKLRADIEEFGWHVLKVLPDDEHPPHAYSVGLFESFKHPELVVVGLAGEIAHVFINNVADEIRDGARFEAGTRYDHIAEGHDITFVRVAKQFYDDYFGQAIEFYGSRDFPVLQLVWPDGNDRFPWEPAFNEELRATQPVLLDSRERM